eukprot:TRINITY_DN4630_c0_g2_i1.p1 TRINITY_DN4630_c0_g2~~TRINITY_DN4630_c0_g2_i1.p1  ORF type:complete len:676 (+),score=143.58 TRINITY_DN4630_c0_g2_i1:306-2030(+)
MFVNVITIGVLLSLMNFVLLQTFAQYNTVSPRLDSFMAVALCSLFFAMAAAFVALMFLFAISSVQPGDLHPWLIRKTHLLFMPNVLLAVSVALAFAALPLMADIIYTDTVFWSSIGIVTGAALLMLFYRFAVVARVPAPGDPATVRSLIEDHHLKKTILTRITRGYLFALLVKRGLKERELFLGLRTLFNSLALAAALLATVCLDIFRELPDNALNGATTPEGVVLAEATGAYDVLGYSICAMLALVLNLMALVTSSLVSASLAMVPSSAFKVFIYKIRNLLFVPGACLSIGILCTLASWVLYAQVSYGDLDLNWALRGIGITVGVVFVLIFVFITHATSGVVKYAMGQASRADLNLNEIFMETSPICCEHGTGSYITSVLAGWQRQLTQGGFSANALTQRLDGVWSGMSFIGALLTGIAFLNFQQGLDVSAYGSPVDKEEARRFVVVTFAALCSSLATTFTSTVFLNNMAIVPRAHIHVFVRKLSPVLLVPNGLQTLSIILLLLSFPTTVRRLYGDELAEAAEYVLWSMAGLTFFIAVSLMLFRGLFSRWLYDPKIRPQTRPSVAPLASIREK